MSPYGWISEFPALVKRITFTLFPLDPGNQIGRHPGIPRGQKGDAHILLLNADHLLWIGQGNAIHQVHARLDLAQAIP